MYYYKLSYYDFDLPFDYEPTLYSVLLCNNEKRSFSEDIKEIIRCNNIDPKFNEKEAFIIRDFLIQNFNYAILDFEEFVL